MKNMKKSTRLLLGLGALAVLAAAGVVFLPAQLVVPESGQAVVITDPLEVELAEVPAALRPLTVPYLRARDYQSELHLGELVEQEGNYRAYLADYSSDGVRVNGLLVVPTGEAPEGGWPAVILVHGYQNPETYQTNGSSYRAWWQGLANTGEFVVFKPDLRGHGESEGRASGAYYSSDYVIDVLNARAALESNQDFPLGKIGLWGHSMAGNVLLRAGAARTEIPALALWAGAVYSYRDFEEYGITDHSFVPRPREEEVTDEEDAPEASRTPSVRELIRQFRGEQTDYAAPFWRNFAPSNFVSELSGAILIEHAADDDVVSVNYSRDLNALLDQTGVPHQFDEYARGGHNLIGGTFNQALTETIEFFRQNLRETSDET